MEPWFLTRILRIRTETRDYGKNRHTDSGTRISSSNSSNSHRNPGLWKMKLSTASQNFEPLRLIRRVESRIGNFEKRLKFSEFSPVLEVELSKLKQLHSDLLELYGSNKNNKTRSALSLVKTARNMGSHLDHFKRVTQYTCPICRTNCSCDPLNDSKFVENRKIIAVAMEKIENQAKKTAAASKRWRLTNHLSSAFKKKHYVVFDTLTIDPKHLKTVTSPNSKVWKNYITALRRKIGIARYGNKTLADEAFKRNKYHSYFCVTEFGKKTNRFHFHVIHTFKYMPRAWSQDPNPYRQKPTRRLIEGFKSNWKYGHSYPIAVRHQEYDAYGNLGWRWPVKNDIPIQPTKPHVLAAYLIKYLTKGDQEKCKNQKMWRTKMTQGLGLNPLKTILPTMTTTDLKLIANSHNRIKMRGIYLPSALIRNRMAAELMRRLKKRFSKKTLFTILRALRPQENIITLLAGAINQSSNTRTQISGNIVIENSTIMAISRFKKRLYDWEKANILPFTNTPTPGVCYK